MKHIKIESKKLLNCLNRVKNAIPSKTGLPVLQYVRLEYYENILIATVTNLDITIEEKIECVTFESGTMIVPCNILISLLKKIKSCELILNNKDNVLEVVTLNGSYEIETTEVNEFPKCPILSTKNEIVITGDKFRDIVQKTLYACSNDDTRLTLKGVLWGNNVVATDGHKLSLIETEENFDEAIIPQEAFKYAIKLSKKSEKMGITTGHKFVLFNFDNTKIYSKLIDATYPPYKKVMPGASLIHFEINKNELIEAAERALIFANNLTHGITIELNNSIVHVITDKSNEEIECAMKGITKFHINATYLIETLLKFDTDDVKIKCYKDKITIVEDKHICLVMFLRGR